MKLHLAAICILLFTATVRAAEPVGLLRHGPLKETSSHESDIKSRAISVAADPMAAIETPSDPVDTPADPASIDSDSKDRADVELVALQAAKSNEAINRSHTEAIANNAIDRAHVEAINTAKAKDDDSVISAASFPVDIQLRGATSSISKVGDNFHQDAAMGLNVADADEEPQDDIDANALDIGGVFNDGRYDIEILTWKWPGTVLCALENCYTIRVMSSSYYSDYSKNSKCQWQGENDSIVNIGCNRVMDVSGNKCANGQEIVLYPRTGGRNQKWSTPFEGSWITQAGNTRFQIKTKGTWCNRYITWGDGSDGSRLTLQKSAGNKDLRWFYA